VVFLGTHLRCGFRHPALPEPLAARLPVTQAPPPGATPLRALAARLPIVRPA
jgi:hypothetical protein